MKSPALSQLRKALAAESSAPSPRKAANRTSPPEKPVDDDTLWRQATQGVAPLKDSNRANPETPGLSRADRALRQAAAIGEDAVDNLGISDTAALLQPVAGEAVLSFRRTGVQLGQFKKLHEGQLPWRAAVDLHGCTVESAREAVLRLLAEAAAEGLNVVKIVHGKGYSQETGGSLLKTCVNGWLRQHPGVLAFHSAPPRDGGTGAVLALLKRQAQPERRDD